MLQNSELMQEESVSKKGRGGPPRDQQDISLLRGRMSDVIEDSRHL